ncbi:MAG: hypothetical protein WD638_11885 [Nitriliruptoraceae bacterium]
MSRSATATSARRRSLPLVAAIAALAAALLYSAFGLDGPDSAAAGDPNLPNPMGGPAMPAPKEVSGQARIGDLEVAGVEVAMGEVALGVTYVPGWTITNPTGDERSVTIGQPRVLEGCCPGPVYADGELTQAGQQVAVPAGGEVLLQFPLQMHPGMDGPHHLAIPLSSDDGDGALEVTGDFSADAT